MGMFVGDFKSLAISHDFVGIVNASENIHTILHHTATETSSFPNHILYLLYIVDRFIRVDWHLLNQEHIVCKRGLLHHLIIQASQNHEVPVW